jgi:hypothetical protein
MVEMAPQAVSETIRALRWNYRSVAERLRAKRMIRPLSIRLVALLLVSCRTVASPSGSVGSALSTNVGTASVTVPSPVLPSVITSASTTAAVSPPSATPRSIDFAKESGITEGGFLPNGNVVLASSKELIEWDPRTREEIRRTAIRDLIGDKSKPEEAYYRAGVGIDGKYVQYSRVDVLPASNRVRVVMTLFSGSTATVEKQFTKVMLAAHNAHYVFTPQFSPSARYVALAKPFPDQVEVFDVLNGKNVLHRTDDFRAAVFINGDRMAITTDNDALDVVNLGSGASFRLPGLPRPTFSKDYTLVASVSDKGQWKVQPLSAGSKAKTGQLEGMPPYCEGCRFDWPDASHVRVTEPRNKFQRLIDFDVGTVDSPTYAAAPAWSGNGFGVYEEFERAKGAREFAMNDVPNVVYLTTSKGKTVKLKPMQRTYVSSGSHLLLLGQEIDVFDTEGNHVMHGRP